MRLGLMAIAIKIHHSIINRMAIAINNNPIQFYLNRMAIAINSILFIYICCVLCVVCCVCVCVDQTPQTKLNKPKHKQKVY